MSQTMFSLHQIEGPEDVRRAVEFIRKWAHGPQADSELLHDAEDQLYALILKTIANNACSNPQACAAEAIKSKQIRFPRSCS